MRRRTAAIGIVLVSSACTSEVASEPPSEPDPVLLEAVEWYLGTGGQVDDDRARQLLNEAVELGDGLSLMWLARVHSTGRMGFARDETRARQIAAGVIEDVARRAEAGVLEAEFLMGTAHDEGLGREVDAVEAAVWYRRAAERGHVLAQHNLGNVYAAGRGVEQDHSEAIVWWERAATAGDAIPALRLGEAYENGVGTVADLDVARRWYQEAASRGNRSAQEALERLGAP